MESTCLWRLLKHYPVHALLQLQRALHGLAQAAAAPSREAAQALRRAGVHRGGAIRCGLTRHEKDAAASFLPEAPQRAVAEAGKERTRAVAFSLLTGLMIATYTIIDGIGVRLSGSPVGYIGWLFILNPIPIVIIAVARRRGQVFVFLRTNWRLGVLGGGLNLGAYGLAIWALTLGTMAHVSAIRETSVIIAALIGSRLLREPFGPQRVLAATVVTCGVMLIALHN